MPLYQVLKGRKHDRFFNQAYNHQIFWLYLQSVTIYRSGKLILCVPRLYLHPYGVNGGFYTYHATALSGHYGACGTTRKRAGRLLAVWNCSYTINVHGKGRKHFVPNCVFQAIFLRDMSPCWCFLTTSTHCVDIYIYVYIYTYIYSKNVMTGKNVQDSRSM